jgi:hypothetical protein
MAQAGSAGPRVRFYDFSASTQHVPCQASGLLERNHRRVALQDVRFAVEEATKGIELEHRLMDFNNLPTTRLEDVKRVLAVAIERVRQRLRETAPQVND